MGVDKFVEKIVQDETLLFPECGLKKEAVQETVLKKLENKDGSRKKFPLSKKMSCPLIAQASHPVPLVLLHLS